MKYIIQETDRTPPILNCISRSENDIAAGVYPYNTKLPSKRIIANEVGVSTITVEHAYALLCDEGYVQSKERSRYFVIFRIDDGFAISSGRKIPHPPHIHTDTSVEFPFSTLTKTMRSVQSGRIYP